MIGEVAPILRSFRVLGRLEFAMDGFVSVAIRQISFVSTRQWAALEVKFKGRLL